MSGYVAVKMHLFQLVPHLWTRDQFLFNTWIVSWCACTNNFWVAFHNTQTPSSFLQWKQLIFSIWQCRVASRIYCLLFRCYCLKLDSSVTFFVVFFYIFYFFRVSVCGMFKYTMNAWTDVVSQLRLFVIAFALIFWKNSSISNSFYSCGKKFFSSNFHSFFVRLAIHIV